LENNDFESLGKHLRYGHDDVHDEVLFSFLICGYPGEKTVEAMGNGRIPGESSSTVPIISISATTPLPEKMDQESSKTRQTASVCIPRNTTC
jgi:hypothetical protein